MNMVTIENRMPAPLTVITTTAMGELYPGFNNILGGASAGRYNVMLVLLSPDKGLRAET
jgi:hypothetical protein